MIDTPLANIVRLPDGRRLCYAWYDAAACRQNLRVIAPDRPGYGRSDFLAGDH
ncbi:MAG TPA: hypothetical protein VMV35_10635 [Halothiobacillus sp.]|nr:hypothetical protein [Halothiobacillus sp.]